MYTVIKNFENLPKFDLTKPIACDTETDGLYGPVRTLQMYQPKTSSKVFIIDTDYIDWNLIADWLKPMWTVWQNAPYDFGTMKFTTKEFDDTLWLSRIAFQNLNSGRPGDFSLDNLVKYIGEAKLYNGLDKKAIQKTGFIKGAYLSKMQLRYAATDVIAVYKLWNHPAIQKARENFSYKIGKLTLHNTVKIQQNGATPNHELAKIEYEKAETKILKNIEELKKFGSINVNSPKQVKAKLTELLGHQPEKTDAKMLLVLMLDYQNTQIGEFAELVYNQRKLIKRLGVLENYQAYDKFYTFFNPLGAATSRFKSNGAKGDVVINGVTPQHRKKDNKTILNTLNFQNITRDLQYLFQQNKPGFVHIHADYSTAELRAGCSIMGDENMRKALLEGKDLHKIAATLADSSLSYDTVSKTDRQKGKAINFGFIFGISAKGFGEYAYTGYGVKFTEQESKAIRDTYFKQYPSIARYIQFWWNNYKTKITTTPQGWPSKPRLGTDAINHATQGCIAETVRLAAYYMIKEWPEAVNYIYNIVHDCIDGYYPEDEAELWAERKVWAMKKAWEEECKLPMLKFKDIPMPVEYSYIDPKTGKYIEKEI